MRYCGIAVAASACMCVLLHGDVLAEDGNAENAAVFIETPVRQTQGFPIILRITANGPQRVPMLSVFDEIGEIVVTLVSKTTGTEYVIWSTRRFRLVVIGAHGEPRDDIARDMWLVSLGAGGKRTMLLDLSCLIPEFGRGTILDDVPPGEYTMRVKLRSSGQVSNAVDLEIVAPSEAEKRFMAAILKKGLVRRGKGINWTRVLQRKIRISRPSIETLGERANSQLAFHVLLSDLLSSDAPAEDLATEPLATARIPAYLEPERQALLFEVNFASRRLQEQKYTELMTQHPGLEWRLKKVRAGEKDFLRYKRSRPSPNQ